MPHLNW
jgi:hypothetical protein